MKGINVLVIIIFSVLMNACYAFGFQKGDIKITNNVVDNVIGKHIDVSVEIDSSEVSIYNDEDKEFVVIGNSTYSPTLTWVGYGPREIKLICTIESGTEKGKSYTSTPITVNNDKVVPVLLFQNCFENNGAPNIRK